MKKIGGLVLLVLGMMACNDEETVQPQGAGTIDLKIETSFNSNSFELAKSYTTSENEKVSFEQFRFWVSKVELVKSDGSTYSIPDSYFLIQYLAKDEVVQDKFTLVAGKRETVNLTAIPSGTYIGVKFGIGVDAQYNDNLTLAAGELNLLQNMTNISWMWHTSYIFSKLAGTIETTTGNVPFVLETGANNNYKAVSQTFTTPLVVNSETKGIVSLGVDVAKLLNGISINRDAKLSAGKYLINASTADVMGKLAGNYPGSFIRATSSVN